MASTNAPSSTGPRQSTVSIDELFKAQLEEKTIEIEGVGRFRIRALSRAEVMSVRGKGYPFDVVEQHMLSLGLVEPTMTVAQVARWQRVAPAGHIEPLGDEIMRLSKMDKGAAKEVMQNFREES